MTAPTSRRPRDGGAQPPVRRARGAHAVQPVAMLLGVLGLGVCLVLSLDVVSAAVALVIELALLPLLRIPVRRLLLARRRCCSRCP